MIGELESVVLEVDMPQKGLLRGDIGVVALVHDQGAGYEVEFSTLDGETMAVITLLADQIRPASGREIAHARSVS